jgi:hypothetical protein
MLDVAKMLEELKQEKAQLEEAINTLERLAQGRGPRRGRPPSSMSDGAAAPAPRRRGRPKGSKNKKVAAATSTPKDSAA